MQAILNVLNQIPPDAYSIVVEVLVGAIAASPLVSMFNHFMKVHSSKIKLAVTLFTCLNAGALAYLHSDPAIGQQLVGPWFAVVQGWLIFAISQPIYKYFLKDLWRGIGNLIQKQVASVAAAEALGDDVLSALEPEGGLVITPDPVPAPAFAATRVEVQDFSN